MAATNPDGTPGLTWKTRYGVVGMNVLGYPDVVDGLNEKGMAGGVLYFAGFAGYSDPAKADPAQALAPWNFLTWALTSFATVAEVRAAIDRISIIDIASPELGGLTPPFHFTLHDASGATLVVEPIGGELKVHDNPIGVMTNSPPLDWHLTNLRNYVNLSPVDAEAIEIRGQIIEPLGGGSGLLGIPGDPTPPSRFVRAVGLVVSVTPLPDAAQTVRLAEHVLNNFDVPLGYRRSGKELNSPQTYTQWSSIANLVDKQYYVKTHDNQVLRRIDLMSFDLDAKDMRFATLKPALAAPKLAFQKP